MQTKLFKNIVYKDVFTNKEIEDLYQTININQKEKTSTTAIYAQKIWFNQLPESVISKINSIAKEIYDEPVKLQEISFARYSKQYGDLPILTPHFDNAFSTPRVTIDIQVKSNIDWAIIVDNKSFTLKDNEALTFSGTNQIHWREYKKFKDDDFIEMIFAHFSIDSESSYKENHKSDIAEKLVVACNNFARTTIQGFLSNN
jgi:hypothetical protein